MLKRHLAQLRVIHQPGADASAAAVVNVLYSVMSWSEGGGVFSNITMEMWRHDIDTRRATCSAGWGLIALSTPTWPAQALGMNWKLKNK